MPVLLSSINGLLATVDQSRMLLLQYNHLHMTREEGVDMMQLL